MKKIVQLGLIVSLLNTSVSHLNAFPSDDYPVNTAHKSIEKSVPSIVPIILLGTLGTLSGLLGLSALSEGYNDKKFDSLKERIEARKLLAERNNRNPTEKEITDRIKSYQTFCKKASVYFLVASITSFIFMIKKIIARNQAKRALKQAAKAQHLTNQASA